MPDVENCAIAFAKSYYGSSTKPEFGWHPSSPNDRATQMIHTNKLTFVIFIYFGAKILVFDNKNKAKEQNEVFFKQLKYSVSQKAKFKPHESSIKKDGILILPGHR